MSTPELKPETPITDAMLETNGIRCACSERPVELCRKLESALNAAREALSEIEECANNAANDNNIGRVGTIAFILLRDKAESALAQISPQQSKTT